MKTITTCIVIFIVATFYVKEVNTQVNKKTEHKYYSGFDLWNEFRLGYKFDLNAAKVPLFLNLQWPFGYGLCASNKPESFKQFSEEKRGILLLSYAVFHRI